MKNKLSQACLTASVVAIFVVALPEAGHAVPGIPDFILEYQGQPAIAVFEDLGESYALGCPKLRNLWSGVQVERTTSSRRFNRILRDSPVAADIPCNGSIDPYAPSGEPGALVIRHRDGKYYRHYIDSIEFITAIGAGDLIPISKNEFYSRFPNRGTDFKVSR